jgi:hypothetical protein
MFISNCMRAHSCQWQWQWRRYCVPLNALNDTECQRRQLQLQKWRTTRTGICGFQRLRRLRRRR